MRRLFAYLCTIGTIAVALGLPAPAAAATAPDAARLDAYLASKGSPMTGQGAAFVASGGRWQVDPRLLIAIAGAESSFGQITCAPYNAWGWGCPDGPYRFSSWADGIDTVMRGLRTGYLAEGRTSVAQIHLKYAPLGAANDPTGLNNHWTINVSRFIVEMGGDPNDVDMDGIAGSVPLGPVGGAPVDDFGFTEAGRTRAKIQVATGAPEALVVEVRNTGSATWHPRDVRLRRTDSESRIVGAPYGALATSRPVRPGATGRFVVQLGAVGSSSEPATTSWRLEGPSGPFGEEIERSVTVAVARFVAVDPVVEVTPTNGVAGGPSTWNAIVRVRNAGSDTWQRDGDAGVLLGLVDTAGDAAPEGWINPRVAARMLERAAAPGEQATFAFRVRGDAGALAVQPFRASGWSPGAPAIVELGDGGSAAAAKLRQRTDAAHDRAD